MTDTTDIKALREAALKATKGEWRAFTDIRTGTCAVHTPEDKGCGDIVDWPGFDGAAGSKKQKVANAKYIALANPQTIINLLDQLEAERQRADTNAQEIRKLEFQWEHRAPTQWAYDQACAALHAQRERAEKAEAALKGEQVPVAWLNDAHLARGHIEGEAGEQDAGPGMIPVYRQAIASQKPVVLPDDMREDILRCVDEALVGCNSLSAPDYVVRVAGWLDAGGIVK